MGLRRWFLMLIDDEVWRMTLEKNNNAPSTHMQFCTRREARKINENIAIKRSVTGIAVRFTCCTNISISRKSSCRWIEPHVCTVPPRSAQRLSKRIHATHAVLGQRSKLESQLIQYISLFAIHTLTWLSTHRTARRALKGKKGNESGAILP